MAEVTRREWEDLTEDEQAAIVNSWGIIGWHEWHRLGLKSDVQDHPDATGDLELPEVNKTAQEPPQAPEE